MFAAARALCCLSCCLLLGGLGCAHHRKDQYAYAPPYAPPVYPQPVSYQQPGAAVAASPAIVGGPATGVGPPTMAGTPCGPSVQQAAMQGSPCPPGEYIVPGSMVGGEMPCTPCQ